MSQALFIVGIGGTAVSGSSTEVALRLSLAAAGAAGARVRLFGSTELCALPHYLTGSAAVSPEAAALVDAVRMADGVILASPGYHGSVSGLVKNAIDYLEETARDARPYLHGRPVGVIATAYGWQATGSTLAALRSVVHALRGWPTPLGAAINTSSGPFTGGTCQDPRVADQLSEVARQVCAFASVCRDAADSAA